MSSSARRTRYRRDRHGHGRRGPMAWPPVPEMLTRREAFDELVLDAASRMRDRLGTAFPEVELVVEEVPTTDPAPWELDVPLGRLVPAHGRQPARVVVHRRPIETRATDPRELATLILEVIAEQIAALLGVDPEEFEL